MKNICCILPKTDYKDLLPEQKNRFGFLVHLFRKKGYTLPDAKERAYSQLWSDEIPFDRRTNMTRLSIYKECLFVA
jgi:hypothetical protein